MQLMSSPLLLDTNVLMYAIDTRSSFHQQSRHFIDTYQGEMFTSSKNLSEYISAGTRGDQPIFTVEEALQDIEDFNRFLTVLYPNKDSFSLFRNLIGQYLVRGKRVHDVEIASIALANGITQIVTFNTSDFKSIAEITVVTP